MTWAARSNYALLALIFAASFEFTHPSMGQVQPIDGSVPTSQPTNGQIQKSPNELIAEFSLTTRQLSEMIPPEVLSNADKRAEFGPRAIPVVYHRLQLVDQLAATRQIPPNTLMKMRATSQALLYLLNDQRTVTRVDGMIASIDPARKLAGQLIHANAAWLGAGYDKDKQSQAADEVEKLDRANTMDMRLTQLTLTMAEDAKTPELENRLLHLVTDVMTDALARSQKRTIQDQLDADAKLHEFVDKPIEIAGKTLQGDDFTSSNWKGKVVLVDFWATWCVPCRAELPHILDAYNQYHSKGLEIVSISSDSTAKPLQNFLAQNNLPWTHLFDPQTAVARLHPLCAKYGITTLPVMFIIDKQGILRGVNGWKQMDDMIPQLLAENSPATQKTENK